MRELRVGDRVKLKSESRYYSQAPEEVGEVVRAISRDNWFEVSFRSRTDNYPADDLILLENPASEIITPDIVMPYYTISTSDSEEIKEGMLVMIREGTQFYHQAPGEVGEVIDNGSSINWKRVKFEVTGKINNYPVEELEVVQNLEGQIQKVFLPGQKLRMKESGEILYVVDGVNGDREEHFVKSIQEGNPIRKTVVSVIMEKHNDKLQSKKFIYRSKVEEIEGEFIDIDVYINPNSFAGEEIYSMKGITDNIVDKAIINKKQSLKKVAEVNDEYRQKLLNLANVTES